jgi:hypothetical protein
MQLGQKVSIQSLVAHGKKVIFAKKHNLENVHQICARAKNHLQDHNVIMALTSSIYFSICFRAKPTSRILLKNFRQTCQSPAFSCGWIGEISWAQGKSPQRIIFPDPNERWADDALEK